ncbi:MAG: nucleotidyltransferase family protein [Desulforegulaceae bacterium]|nr:nucleotidyltransferase family protein [Desulforegulaceae bacterium]
MNFSSEEISFLSGFLSSKVNGFEFDANKFNLQNAEKILETAEEQKIFPIYGNELLSIFEKNSNGFDKNYWLERLSKHEKRAFNLTIRLLKILNFLKEEQIFGIPVKGPLLAEFLYNDISSRAFADLDIFIFQKDLYKAVKILEKQGYKPELDLDEKKTMIFSRHEYDFKLYDKSSHTIVELHWELSGRYTKSPITLDNYFRTLCDFNILNKKVQKLSNETEFIYLCIHSGKHCYEKLEMLYSIAVYFNKIKDSFDLIINMADEMKCRKIVLFSVYLCIDFFNLKVDENVLNQIKAYKDFGKIKNQVANFIENNANFSKTRFSNLHIKLQENIYLKIILRLRLIFTPTCSEWAVVKLPAKLSFLYYFIRPFRLVFLFFK